MKMLVIQKQQTLFIETDNGFKHTFTIIEGGDSKHVITRPDGNYSTHIMVPTETMLVKIILE